MLKSRRWYLSLAYLKNKQATNWGGQIHIAEGAHLLPIFILYRSKQNLSLENNVALKLNGSWWSSCSCHGQRLKPHYITRLLLLHEKFVSFLVHSFIGFSFICLYYKTLMYAKQFWSRAKRLWWANRLHSLIFWINHKCVLSRVFYYLWVIYQWTPSFWCFFDPQKITWLSGQGSQILVHPASCKQVWAFSMSPQLETFNLCYIIVRAKSL